MAAEVCEASIAVITLIDAERQWFKADVGLGGLSETPREYAFCTHTIQCDELMEVPDARDDPRFATNPFVNSDPGVRFYAGAPLMLPGGTRIGALCVLDPHVRNLDDAQRRTLVSLAGLVTQALAAKSAELDDLYTNAPCGDYSLDTFGRFVRANDTALRWFGFTREEMLANPPAITDFLDAEGRQYFNARFPRLKRDGRLFDIEYDLISRNGQRRRVMGSASAVRGRDGKFLMTRTVVHDISELHRTRDHLRRLGVEQQAVIDTDLVGIVKVKDRTISWANKGVEKMLGWSLAELNGHSTHVFYPDDASYAEAGAAAPALLSRGGSYRGQVTMHRKDGSTLAVDTSIAMMPGHPGELLCVLQDISELKHAEDTRIRASALKAENRQLVEAARVKGVLLANMSREFYTPPNAIIGSSHLLGTGAFPADSPRFGRYLADIGASGQQLLAQVQSVLAYTDAESGRISLQPQRVALRAVLESLIDIAQPAARARRVDVALAVDPGRSS